MNTPGRITLRVVSRDHDGGVLEVIEQSIPATEHAVALFFRRDPFRRLAAWTIVGGGTITVETVQGR